MEQLAEGQVIGMGLHHDELEAFLLLPCVEADLQPHPHCSDLALTQCQRDTSLSTWKEPPGCKSTLSSVNQHLYRLKEREQACIKCTIGKVTTKATA